MCTQKLFFESKRKYKREKQGIWLVYFSLFVSFQLLLNLLGNLNPFNKKKRAKIMPSE